MSKMKNIIYLILVGYIFLIISCSLENSKKDDWCQDVVQKTSDYIYNYQMSDNMEYLDSALILTNKALGKCAEFDMLLKSRKLDILSKRREFNEAILYVKSFEKPYVNDLDYYNNYLIQRFTVMQYQFEGDTSKRNDCLKIIINTLGKYIERNKSELDTLILYEDVDEILKNPLSIPFIQYYYMRSALMGFDESKKELDTLLFNKKINEKFLDFIYQYSLDNDIMDFSGL